MVVEACPGELFHHIQQRIRRDVADAITVYLCELVHVAFASRADDAVVEEQPQVALAPSVLCDGIGQQIEDAKDDLDLLVERMPPLMQLHLPQVFDEGERGSHVSLSLDLESAEDVEEEVDLLVGDELQLLCQDGREGF